MKLEKVAFGRLLTRVAVALVVVACGGDAGTGPAASPVGEYQLQSMDDVSLPVVLSTGDSLLSGTLSMRTDSTFVLNPTYRQGSGVPWTTTIAGRWTGMPSALHYFAADGTEIATGTYARGRISFVQQNTFEFVQR